MSYTKSQMFYMDYKWTARPVDDPSVTGKPDSTKFNKHEGYEVLYLINTLAEIWGVTSYMKMEKMIRQGLPSKIVSQSDVRSWIYENLNKY